MTRFTLMLTLLLAGCAEAAPPPPPPLTGQARADAETAEACRQRAEQVYDIRHRDDIYSPLPQVDSPFASNYRPGAVPSQNLSALHEHDQLIADCIRNTGAETSHTPQ
jgi:hypothetical protein